MIDVIGSEVASPFRFVGRSFSRDIRTPEKWRPYYLDAEKMPCSVILSEGKNLSLI
jgi:hypothetical protein